MERSDLYVEARLTKEAERYEDLVRYMKKITELGVGLDTEEKNLLSVGYKNVVGARSSSWRKISNIEAKVEDGSVFQIRAARYRGLIEEELKGFCNDLLSLLDKYLLHTATANEDKVFYNTLKGDYYGYLAEIASSGDREKVMQHAEDAYSTALKIAVQHLSATNPVRLGLALNFSAFLYEIKQSKSKACEMLKLAFENALSELDILPEDSYKESTRIMQLLKDNLTLWSSEEATAD